MVWLEKITRKEAIPFCEQYHYSGTLPSTAHYRWGVVEDGDLIGVVAFGVTVSPQIHKTFGVGRREILELRRVALKEHQTPVSKIVAVGIRLLAKERPDCRLIVSYADTAQGHHGGIYQAGNWIFTGSNSNRYYLFKGEIHHPRTLNNIQPPEGMRRADYLRTLDPDLQYVPSKPKHRYLYVLDDSLKESMETFRKEYPKKDSCVSSSTGRTSRIHREDGGSNPTLTLHRYQEGLGGGPTN